MTETHDIPDVILFANGGKLVVKMIEDGQVFYALHHPDLSEPLLRRRTIANFHESVRFTHEKIVAEQGGEAEV